MKTRRYNRATEPQSTSAPPKPGVLAFQRPTRTQAQAVALATETALTEGKWGGKRITKDQLYDLIRPLAATEGAASTRQSSSEVTVLLEYAGVLAEPEYPKGLKRPVSYLVVEAPTLVAIDNREPSGHPDDNGTAIEDVSTADLFEGLATAFGELSRRFEDVELVDRDG